MTPLVPPSTDLLLNARYRDDVSSWEGICTAVYLYANGCVRGEISGTSKDGAPESFVFDEQALILVEPVAKPKSITAKVGGPRDHAPVPR